jgi:predicted nucleotidyltransferase
MEKLYKGLVEQKRYLESLGYHVLYVGLFGSQNYGLSDENSDIDVRAIVLPTIEQLIKKEKIASKYKTEIGEIDVKDVMWYYEIIRKGNFTFIEPMQTKYYIGDKQLRVLFKDIQVNLRSLKGDMYNKAEAFRKEFAGKAKEIQTWGYDPKQLHHLFRLMLLMSGGNVNVSFIDYSDNKPMTDWLMSVKRNHNNVIDSFAGDLIDISSTESIKRWIDEKTSDYISEDYKYEEVDLLDEVTKYIKAKLKLLMYKDDISFVREHRTFDQPVPKSDLVKFEKLRELNGQDICYIVYESLEIL